MSRFSRPSTGTILGGAALFVALGGTAMAAASAVNIADPTTPSRIAHVDASGKLEVGDGAGALTVNGTVTTQQAAPGSFVHGAAFGLSSTRGCVKIANAPADKAMIIKEVRVDVFADPSPGIGQTVELFSDPSCAVLVADVNPPGLGQTVVPFDPGVGIKAGSAMGAIVSGSVQAETYSDGYLVSSSLVPSAPPAGQQPAMRPRQ
jgi:hypothetical protein